MTGIRGTSPSRVLVTARPARAQASCAERGDCLLVAGRCGAFGARLARSISSVQANWIASASSTVWIRHVGSRSPGPSGFHRAPSRPSGPISAVPQSREVSLVIHVAWASSSTSHITCPRSITTASAAWGRVSSGRLSRSVSVGARRVGRGWMYGPWSYPRAGVSGMVSVLPWRATRWWPGARPGASAAACAARSAGRRRRGRRSGAARARPA